MVEMTHQAKAADLYRRACEVAEVAFFCEARILLNTVIIWSLGATIGKSCTQVLTNKTFQHEIVNIFLPITFSICFGCLKVLVKC